MKTQAILTSLVLAATAAVAQQAPSEPTLKPGAEVKLEPVAAAKWIQGEPPKAFEPGKIYVFECWATWCGPCVAAIPHLNQLHQKYRDKGLRVHGMNVWEDGEDKVAKFVKDKGDGMSYPVAYTGRGSAFETEWLKAAGVQGIPHAFVVKEGKLLLATHPSQLTDSLVEALLAGDEAADKAIAEMNAAKGARDKTGAVMMAFRQAASRNDTDTMAAKLEEFKQLAPDSPYLASMQLDLLVAKKDWPAAAKALGEIPAGPGRQMSVMIIARKVGMGPDAAYPADFIKAVADAWASLLEGTADRANPLDFVTLASLRWKAGDKEAAVASARKAVAAAKQMPANTTPAAPWERFAKSLEDGSLPTMQELSGWLREAMPQRAAVPATPLKPAPAKQ